MATTTASLNEVLRRRDASGYNWVRLRQLLSYILLFLLALIFLYPFYLSVITSFRTLPQIAANPVVLWPEQLSLDAYRRMQSLDVPRWIFNSAETLNGCF